MLKRELPRPTSVPDTFVHFESKLTEELEKRAEELVRAEVTAVYNVVDGEIDRI